MSSRERQVLEEKKSSQELWDAHVEQLEKFMMQNFQVRSNHKKFVTDVRRQCVKVGSVTIKHDSRYQ